MKNIIITVVFVVGGIVGAMFRREVNRNKQDYPVEWRYFEWKNQNISY